MVSIFGTLNPAIRVQISGCTKMLYIFRFLDFAYLFSCANCKKVLFLFLPKQLNVLYQKLSVSSLVIIKKKKKQKKKQ